MSPYPIDNILFLDIETVPQQPSFDRLPDDWKMLWQKKAENLLRFREGETAESIYPRAGIYAEFGKIICIGCGIVSGSGSSKRMLIKSFYGDDEKQLLEAFVDMLNKWSADGKKFLCAHNGKEFDFPYLSRRMIINNIAIPPILNTSGKKPWEIRHLDTMELWKFGDYKSFTSLNLLAHSLGMPTPKNDIDGSMVCEVYWSARTPLEKEKNLQRIVSYCQKDVIVMAQIFLRMHAEELIDPENIAIK